MIARRVAFRLALLLGGAALVGARASSATTVVRHRHHVAGLRSNCRPQRARRDCRHVDERMPAAERAQGAVEWASKHIGDRRYDGHCGTFVANAFGAARFGHETAWQGAQALTLHHGPPPPGTLIFFRPDARNGYDGHVAIALPKDKMISALSDGVAVATMADAYWQRLYAGWSAAPARWPGRRPTGAGPSLQSGPSLSPPARSTAYYAYRVFGTCADGACGLVQRAGPGYSAYAQIGISYDGDELDIVCQAAGQLVEPNNTQIHSASTVWDRLTDGDWVSDVYVTTPGVGTFSPPISPCG
jgi:NlpC/P60 family